MRPENSVFSSLTPYELAEIMQELGFRAELDLSDPNMPCIGSVSDGWTFLVFLTSPDQTGYNHAQIFTMNPNSRVTPAQCNMWNNEYRFANMYCQSDAQPLLKMDLILHLVTKGYLRRCFAFWENLQAKFLKFIPAAPQAGMRSPDDASSGENSPEPVEPAAAAPAETAIIAEPVEPVTVDTTDPSAAELVQPIPAVSDEPAAPETNEQVTPSAEMSRGDLSTIERLLGDIVSNTRAMVSSNPGGDLRAIVNRLETANGYLSTIASNTRH